MIWSGVPVIVLFFFPIAWAKGNSKLHELEVTSLMQMQVLVQLRSHLKHEEKHDFNSGGQEGVRQDQLIQEEVGGSSWNVGTKIALADALNATALAELEVRQRAPLFSSALETIIVNVSKAFSMPSFREDDPVSLVFYHKTGNYFADGFAHRSANLTGGVDSWQSNSTMRSGPEFLCEGRTTQSKDVIIVMKNGTKQKKIKKPEMCGIFDWISNDGTPDLRENVSVRHFWKYSMPRETWQPPETGPIIHFVRGSVDLVVSGYRYHKIAGEWWANDTGVCHGCADLVDWMSMFNICNRNCTYRELLNSLTEKDGAIVETLQERGQMQRMLGNMQRWANDPRVLHITMDHLQTNFNKTITCINNFLGNLGFSQEELHFFEDLNVPDSSPHTTSGKYDNTAIIDMLRQQPVWGKEFAAVDAFMYQIYHRQSDLHGCPMPESAR